MELKYLLCLILIIYITPLAQNRNFGINFNSIYENWNLSDDPDFSEITSFINFTYLVNNNLSLALTARHASVSDDISDLSGFTDTQLLSVYKIPSINLSLNGGINIPSGKTRLTQDEFLTSQVINSDFFSLRTSGFGQGFNVFLGATWLKPVSDDFVIGLGLSYQFKGEYEPREEFSSHYSPSNEISVTGGFDIKLTPTSTLTGDVTSIFYSADKLEGVEVFSAGNRTILNTLYRKYWGFNYLSAFMLYRLVATDEIKGLSTVFDNEKMNPDQFYLSLSFLHRISARFKFDYRIFTSVYEQTEAPYSGYTMLGAAFTPEIKLSSNISIPVFLKYSFSISSSKSSLQNSEVGTGLMITF